MKKTVRIIFFVLLVSVLACFTSCSIYDTASQINGNYMTREEANKLLQGIEENVTVNAGDNYNITINLF